MCCPGWALSCKARTVYLCAFCSPIYPSTQASPGYSENEGMYTVRPNQKTLQSPSSLFLGSLTVGEASCHTGRTLKQPRGEVHTVRMLKHLWSLHGEEVQPSINDLHRITRHVSKPPPVKSADTTAVPANISAAISWGVMSQNHLAKEFLDS